MEYVFYGLLAVAFIAFVVLVIRSYRKKLASGCCGASDESVKKNKVADKDKSHYPYEKLLLLTEWSVKLFRKSRKRTQFN